MIGGCWNNVETKSSSAICLQDFRISDILARPEAISPGQVRPTEPIATVASLRGRQGVRSVTDSARQHGSGMITGFECLIFHGGWSRSGFGQGPDGFRRRAQKMVVDALNLPANLTPIEIRQDGRPRIGTELRR